MNGLFLKALLAFLALPGMVAFVVPLLLVTPAGRRHRIEPLGLAPLVLGVVVLGLTVREFYVTGRGTLAPWSPPRTLVTSGLYRYSRNPMYVGVLLILCGWAVGLRSRPLAILRRVRGHRRPPARPAARGAVPGADARRGVDRLSRASRPMVELVTGRRIIQPHANRAAPPMWLPAFTISAAPRP